MDDICDEVLQTIFEISEKLELPLSTLEISVFLFFKVKDQLVKNLVGANNTKNFEKNGSYTSTIALAVVWIGIQTDEQVAFDKEDEKRYTLKDVIHVLYDFTKVSNLKKFNEEADKKEKQGKQNFRKLKNHLSGQITKFSKFISFIQHNKSHSEIITSYDNDAYKKRVVTLEALELFILRLCNFCAFVHELLPSIILLHWANSYTAIRFRPESNIKNDFFKRLFTFYKDTLKIDTLWRKPSNTNKNLLSIFYLSLKSVSSIEFEDISYLAPNVTKADIEDFSAYLNELF